MKKWIKFILIFLIFYLLPICIIFVYTNLEKNNNDAYLGSLLLAYLTNILLLPIKYKIEINCFEIYDKKYNYSQFFYKNKLITHFFLLLFLLIDLFINYICFFQVEFNIKGFCALSLFSCCSLSLFITYLPIYNYLINQQEKIKRKKNYIFQFFELLYVIFTIIIIEISILT